MCGSERLRQEIAVCLETEPRHTGSSKGDSHNQLGEISCLVIQIHVKRLLVYPAE